MIYLEDNSTHYSVDNNSFCLTDKSTCDVVNETLPEREMVNLKYEITKKLAIASLAAFSSIYASVAFIGSAEVPEQVYNFANFTGLVTVVSGINMIRAKRLRNSLDTSLELITLEE